VERDTSETWKEQEANHSRTKQTARRGAKNLRGGAAAFMPQNGLPAPFSMPNMLSMADLPPPPPGPMPFDMSNPMAFFAMMASMGNTMPGMPVLPMLASQGDRYNGQARGGKCHDYHAKGFCAKGNMCLFEHDPLPDDVPEYDPDQPSLSTQTVPHTKRRQAAKGIKGGRPRADFSLPGPTHDRTNTTLVVEQIPDDRFSEDNVRDFFSQFGPIADIKMHAYKRLAILKFEDHASADQAYNSPQAVFENRFVKVYWYQDAGSQGDNAPPPEPLDLEEIARRTAEAQLAFEARRARLEEADARSAELDRLLREKDAEIQDIKRQLAELAGDDENAALEAEFSQDLATLQAEAETLFAQKDSAPHAERARGYLPRGMYHGRGYVGGRGAYRGRAAFPGGRTSVKRLDNRPRRLAVAGIEKGSAREEAVRQYLVVSLPHAEFNHTNTNVHGKNMPECTSIEPHPEVPDTLVLTFVERYQAEMVRLSPPHPHTRTYKYSLPTLHARFQTLAVLSSSLGSPTMRLLVLRRLKRPTRPRMRATLSRKRRSRQRPSRTRTRRDTNKRKTQIWMLRRMGISGCEYSRLRASQPFLVSLSAFLSSNS
jgi:hypothetical protein